MEEEPSFVVELESSERTGAVAAEAVVVEQNLKPPPPSPLLEVAGRPPNLKPPPVDDDDVPPPTLKPLFDGADAEGAEETPIPKEKPPVPMAACDATPPPLLAEALSS